MMLNVAHAQGHGDVIASWGEDIAWIQSFIPTGESSDPPER